MFEQNELMLILFNIMMYYSPDYKSVNIYKEFRIVLQSSFRTNLHCYRQNRFNVISLE